MRHDRFTYKLIANKNVKIEHILFDIIFTETEINYENDASIPTSFMQFIWFESYRDDFQWINFGLFLTASLYGLEYMVAIHF